MKNFILKFGKYKGQYFLNTPKSYQDWLLAQNWFKMPVALSELQEAQKMASQCSNKLKDWDGYSKAGEAAYDNMFEAEKAMDAAIFNNSNQCSPFYDGSW